MKNQMSVLEVTNSSAIAKVSFETELQEVGVAYNSNPDTFYVFKCDNVEDVQKQIETAESVGKLIAHLMYLEFLEYPINLEYPEHLCFQ